MSVVCDFCGKDLKSIDRLIQGNNSTHICNECIILCVEIINSTTNSESSVKKSLDDYIIKVIHEAIRDNRQGLRSIIRSV